jgi:Cu2+-exporting ATPase
LWFWLVTEKQPDPPPDQDGTAPAYRDCIHCGTPFSQRARPESEFCCNGCEYVHRLINEQGLEHYYDLRDRRVAPVRSNLLHQRDFAWLEALVASAEDGANGTAHLILDLEGISCVGCVWLIEKVFHDHPGAVRIEINTQYAQVRLAWKPGLFSVVDFAREIQQFGYALGPPGERPQTESRRLLGRLGLCGAFALNAMLFTLPRYLGMDPAFALANLFELLALLFATLSLATGGSYFIIRGFRGLHRGILHIDFPIALGILFAWSGSLLGWLIEDTRFLYFDFVAIFVFLMLTGRWVQERAMERNRNALLSRSQSPRQVQVVSDDLRTESSEPLDVLKTGMRFRILPGQVVPVLAELESLRSSVSLEWINGESEMRTFTQGQGVPSGAQNIGLEPILLRARQPWKEALLARLLATTDLEFRDLWLEKVLRVYLTAVLCIAVAGAAIWALVLGNPLMGLQVLLSVLVVSCPCAIGVAAPLAQEWSVLRLRHAGLFVRSPRVFPALRRLRHLVFDKTGTLTLEAPELTNPEVLEQLSPLNQAILRELVKTSLHPVSRALREALLRLPEPEAVLPDGLSLSESVGYGLEAISGTMEWSLGRPEWKAGDGVHEGDCIFRHKGKALAVFTFRDAVRDEAPQILQQLARRFSIHLLSGDRETKVRAMAQKLELPPSAAVGGQSPEDKAAFIKGLGAGSTLFLGDGANDALGFAAAAVRGTPATPHGLLQEKTDFYFTGRSLRSLLDLFAVAGLRRNALRSVFAFTLLYNLAVLCVALLGFMHPLLAAILMPLSSLASLLIVAAWFQKLPTPIESSKDV